MTNPADLSQVELLSDSGSGRAFALIFESDAERAQAENLSRELALSRRAILIKLPEVNAGNWRLLTESTMQIFETLKLRQVSLVGFGAAGAIVQNVVLTTTRFVRSFILVDATTRPHPTALSRLVDRIEASLPLGLPLRLRGSDFNSRPFLQRMRCPALVVVSENAANYLRKEAKVLATNLPTAWSVELKRMTSSSDLAQHVTDFQEVPARCPQRV